MACTVRWSIAIPAFIAMLGSPLGCADGPQDGSASDPFTTTTAAGSTATASESEGPTSTTTTRGDVSSSDGETVDPDSSTGFDDTDPDATVGDTEEPSCAALPAPDPAWLAEQLDEVAGTLSGVTPLPDGAMLSERTSAGGREAAAAYVHTVFEELGLQTDRHDYSTSGSNVVARLEATSGAVAGTLVVGAHFDAVPGSPGANDNATGVALVVALARHLSEVECRSHEVLFVAFDEEEIGLIGSDAFAQLLVDQGTNVVAVHTIDQMGWDQDGDRAVELERADEGLFEFYEDAASELGIPLTATQTGSTDHVSFRAYGFAAVGLTEEFVSGDTTPHYHQSSDTYATVNLDYLTSTATLMNAAFADFIDAS